MTELPEALQRGAARRCPRCGSVLREERSHFRCEQCGIVEACCEGQQNPLESDSDEQ
jgi:DNA-directed RNA polymerase subunit RPC12/RpoP